MLCDDGGKNMYTSMRVTQANTSQAYLLSGGEQDNKFIRRYRT